MDIALLHYTAPPVVGGVERVLAEHARLMVAAGHRVRVLAGRGGRLDGGVTFLEFPLMDSRNPEVLQVKAALDAGLVPSQFEPLSRRIEEGIGELLEGANVVIAHNICSLNKNLPLTAALRRAFDSSTLSRLILWHHDLAWIGQRYASELHAGYPWDLLRTDTPGSTHVTVSEWRRQELASLFGVPPAAIRVIPNGLEVEAMLKMETRSRQLVDRFDLLHADPLILLPVRITARKNIEMAIRIVGALRSRWPSVKLVVTGPLGAHNPANIEYLGRLIRLRHDLALDGCVHILAEIEPDTMPDAVIADFYALSDMLLLTSTEEGFGIPVIEAGLARIPIFCTDIPPLRELGGPEAHYFLSAANPDAVADQITSILASSPLHSSRKRVFTRYTWEGIYAAHIRPLLETVVS